MVNLNEPIEQFVKRIFAGTAKVNEEDPGYIQMPNGRFVALEISSDGTQGVTFRVLEPKRNPEKRNDVYLIALNAKKLTRRGFRGSKTVGDVAQLGAQLRKIAEMPEPRFASALVREDGFCPITYTMFLEALKPESEKTYRKTLPVPTGKPDCDKRYTDYSKGLRL
jgi:hypothetical protein